MSARILMRRCCWAVALILLHASFAAAHPEGDILPESVAVLEYRVVLSITPADHNTRNKLGIVYYRLGDIQQAEQAFLETLRLDSGNADAMDGLGLVALKRGEIGQAEERFRKAVSLKESDAMNHYHLGFVLEKRGAAKEAEAEYLRSIALRPHGLNLRALARLYRSGKRGDEARALEEKAKTYPLSAEDRKNELL